jgi:hypothetical protein
MNIKMKEYAVIVQRHFRLFQAQTAIKKLNKKLDNDYTFDEFIIRIQERKLLSEVNYVLCKLNSIVNYGNKKITTSQEFLSSFVVNRYEDHILDKPIGPIIQVNHFNKLLIDICKSLLKRFTRLNENISIRGVNNFIECLRLYKEIFELWKNNDHKSLINTLTTSYYELEALVSLIQEKETLTEIDNEYILCLKERQEDFIDKIIFLNGQEYFNNYRHTEVSLDESIQIQIKEMVHNAFWQLLLTELTSKPPVFNQLMKLIEEIRDTFCGLVPSRTDIHTEIHDKIDIIIIKNMMENNAFDDESLMNLCKYIISLIKKFQPPIMDESVNNWEKSMLKQFETKFDYTDFLIQFLRSVFNMLGGIIDYAKMISEEN